jgi:hypothetical protein
MCNWVRKRKALLVAGIASLAILTLLSYAAALLLLRRADRIVTVAGSESSVLEGDKLIWRLGFDRSGCLRVAIFSYQRHYPNPGSLSTFKFVMDAEVAPKVDGLFIDGVRQTLDERVVVYYMSDKTRCVKVVLSRAEVERLQDVAQVFGYGDRAHESMKKGKEVDKFFVNVILPKVGEGREKDILLFRK